MTDPARVSVATGEQREADEYIIDMLAQLEKLARKYGLEELAAILSRATGQCGVGRGPKTKGDRQPLLDHPANNGADMSHGNLGEIEDATMRSAESSFLRK